MHCWFRDCFGWQEGHGVKLDHFGHHIASGVALLFTGQVFINIGVATGLLPTKGLTLPFLSYGGSSLIVSCCLIALVLRVEKECGLGGAYGRG